MAQPGWRCHPMETTREYASAVPQRHPGSALEVLGVATRLGVTSFGGPIAHLGYFHAEYVARRKWLDEQTYADLVALCQFAWRRDGLAGLYPALGAGAGRLRLRAAIAWRHRCRMAPWPQGGGGRRG